MIIDFSITNYGPIRDTVTLSFEASNNAVAEGDSRYVQALPGLYLLRYVLIFGPNASGKSTILQGMHDFLSMINSPLMLKSDRLPYNPHKFDASSSKGDTEFTMNFVTAGERYCYSVSYNAQCVTREKLTVGIDRRTIFTRSTDVEAQLSLISFGSEVEVEEHINRVLEANTLWNNTVLGGLKKVSVEISVLSTLSTWFLKFFTPIIEPGESWLNYVIDGLVEGRINQQAMLSWLRHADLMVCDIQATSEKLEEDKIDALTELIKNSVIGQHSSETQISMLAKRARRRNVEFEHLTPDGRSTFINYKNESLGTQRFFQLAGILDLVLREGHHFSIDELDNSLHPDLMEFFLETYIDADAHSQLVASTHQGELLLNNHITLPDAIWFTQKDRSGMTQLYSLSDFSSDIYELFDDDRKYFEAYRIGEFGTKPYVGSPYYPVD